MTQVAKKTNATSVAILKPRDFPIGTVIDIIPPKKSGISLPDGWVIAEGQRIVDPRSPFKGERLPNLNEDVFLMGGDFVAVGETGGTNDIKSDGEHRHTGRTSGPNGSERVDNGRDKSPARGDHTHTFSTSLNGAHDHGGDNRPKFVTVARAMRIW